MANAGHSAATDIFSFGSSWAVKSDSENASCSVSECPNANNDITHRDVYGNRIAPTADYTLKADVTSLPALGTVVTIATKKVMLTKIVVRTAKGAAPTASASGVEVESSATTRRTYSCGEIALSARHKAQDILALHGSTMPDTIVEATFTFEIEPTLADPKGEIVSSDCSNGRVVAEFTHASGTGAAISAPSVSGDHAVVSSPATPTRPENDYVSCSYAITSSLTGSESSN